MWGAHRNERDSTDLTQALYSSARTRVNQLFVALELMNLI